MHYFPIVLMIWIKLGYTCLDYFLIALGQYHFSYQEWLRRVRELEKDIINMPEELYIVYFHSMNGA